MTLQFEQIVNLPPEVVFAFHEDPKHLTLLHQGWCNFRLLHCGLNIAPGGQVWFEAGVASVLPVVLGFEHTLCEPPRRFRERLIHGPFLRLEHTHEFLVVPEGTLVRDLLDIELPWYYGGALAVRCVVAPMLRRTFARRQAALTHLAQSGELSRAVARSCAMEGG